MAGYRSDPNLLQNHDPRRDHDSRRSGASKTLTAAVLAVLATLLMSASFAAAEIDDSSAEPCWTHRITLPHVGDDVAWDVTMTSTATWVTGELWHGDERRYDASLLRILKGESFPPAPQAWNSSNSDDDANYDVAVRSTYVYTSGVWVNLASDLDMLVIRWTAAGDAVKWARRVNGAAKLDDVAEDVGIDGDGNVVVCGTTEGANGRDWMVVKYSPLGTRKWTWIYDGPAHLNDVPIEMYVDGTGNAYVTGTITTTPTLTAAYTVKLSPAGVRLWGRRYTGPALEPSRTSAVALARCPGGGVYIGGTTWSGTSLDDMYIARYTAAGEKTVFEYGYPACGGVDDDLRDIAVASNGAVIGVGQYNDGDPSWYVWDTSGHLYGGARLFTAGTDGWQAVATDSIGGFYMTKPYDSPSDYPAIRTQRFSVMPRGGMWTSDWAPELYQREVKAIAANGTTVAAVGTDATDSGWYGYDQLVNIWTY